MKKTPSKKLSIETLTVRKLETGLADDQLRAARGALDRTGTVSSHPTATGRAGGC